MGVFFLSVQTLASLIFLSPLLVNYRNGRFLPALTSTFFQRFQQRTDVLKKSECLFLVGIQVSFVEQ